MPLILRLVLILAAAISACAPAQALAPEVSIITSYPGLSGQLGRDAPLYLRLSYRSDVPIRVQAKGYFEGAEVREAVRWNPSPAYPAGSGEALVWIAYYGATRLDEIRIEVSDAGWQPLTVASLRLNIAWSSAPAARGHEPAWVKRLSGAQQSAAAASAAARDDSFGFGFGVFDALIGPLLAIGVPGYFVLQALFVWRFSSGWRIAALAPLLLMGPLMAHAFFALSMGSNIWPLFVIFAAPVLFLYLVALWAARFVVRGALV